MEYLTQIILTALASGSLFTFITFLITRKDNKSSDYESIKSGYEEIKSKLVTNEKDNCRTQMLMLIKLYPEDQSEIMRLAEHYFAILHGDFYMTSIFFKWLKANNIEKPRWFDENE